MNNIKILALGDSYTIGEDVPQSESWPYLLKRNLENRGFSVGLKVVAKTGWTTDELGLAIEQSDLKREYDLVFLLIGVNNQYRGYCIDKYRSEFRRLLLKAKEFSVNNSVFILSIPDWSCTPFASEKDKSKISEEIDAFNRENFEISESEGALYLSITGISRRSADDTRYTASDGLHPSGYQYEKWVEKIMLKIDWPASI
ncbi:MAG: SGNH/GDSL hydrolase family protein [Sporocytophaga sp.]|uniref:SGNH/GDSL hydrolase family protein n=1 Tax=Sporocytophaga sp. TaxID=2231183 RepID=UPI001B25385B|nr:SGNH/GDSL hydrolase family protein [Sporocytophaga sp.]MBO9700261.1 SGNH/GDSL hydrolase family protein [Sporocytophaga sp.]